MTDWKDFYDSRVAALAPQDHLRQVGHTVMGEPIPQSHVDALLGQIAALLALAPESRLLDLCCGNGVFTGRLAPQVATVLGIDLSEALIAVARRDHAAPNLHYLVMDAQQVGSCGTRPEAPFDRILQFAALQHFSPESFGPVLDGMLRIAAPGVRILLGFVPDAALQDMFYDTPERRAEHARRQAEGRDPFGHWWQRETLTAMAAQRGLEVSYHDLPAALHAARYRFHAVLQHPRA